MSSRILEKLLYNQRIKGVANTLLDWPLLFKNPLYRLVLLFQIKKIIKRYERVPFSLRLETTNVCNSACYMCPHSTMKRRQGFMSRNLFQKLIDEAAQMRINHVSLHNFGEPLLDKDFFWRIKYAKEKKIAWVTASTNAMVMSETVSEKIIDSGLDEIFISLDAASKEVYEKIRIGLDFQKVCSNVENLVKTKKNLGVNHPQVIVDFLESDLNKHEKKKFIKKWKGVVDKVCISKIHDWTSKKKSIIKFNYPNYVSFSLTPCRLPFTELSINWDGSVSMCCQDIEEEAIVGDANKESLEQIWQDGELNKIRAKHLTLDVNQLPLCKNCKLRTFWWTF